MAERHFAAAGAQRAGMGSEGGIGSLPQIAQQEQGGGLPSVHAVEILGTPDPEDGGPDELASPAATHVMQNGDNLQPEPGGEDPDDPTASQGGLTTVSATMSDTASPAEPGEGGQGGGIVPDDPRF
jgi:hypothetical protein